jgi:ribose/xylose/arabinose/galactoside ABC-type transport system permease subunit
MKTRMIWPLLILALLLLINVIVQPNFFNVEMKSGHLFGSLIDILRNSAPLIIVSLGLTLVIATKGIDLSIGSVMAISGAMACILVKNGAFAEDGYMLLLVSIAMALLLSAVAGAWNGILVAGIKIQPIVATLILMVAGRGDAQLIGDGQIITVNYKPFLYLGKGYLLTLPFSIYIVAFIFIVATLLTRKTALGLFIESVGSNPVASRLTGIRAFGIIMIVYIFCGFCSGIAGLIASSNVASADGNNLGNLYELDAILAVVIGGTSLNGGRFYLTGTLLGALIIQTLTATIYSVGVPNQMILVVKAIVVLIVCLMQSEEFRKKLSGTLFSRKAASKKGVAA